MFQWFLSLQNDQGNQLKKGLFCFTPCDLCLYVCACRHVHVTMCMDVRGQFKGVTSLFSPLMSQGWTQVVRLDDIMGASWWLKLILLQHRPIVLLCICNSSVCSKPSVGEGVRTLVEEFCRCIVLLLIDLCSS